MKIEFVGGARSVTGSSFILKDNDFTIMIDCGMFQGKNELRDRNFMPLIYDPPAIDSVLLTHAHIDHSGLLPKLVKKGFANTIYATPATCDLCSVMLPDSAHIQEMDVRYINKKNRKLDREVIEPLYTVDDAEETLKYLVGAEYGATIQIHPRIKARFRDAGHILGSSIIELWVDTPGARNGTTKIVFSGDIGPKGQAIIRDPETIDEADILIIESTYGNRLHKSKEDTFNEFRDIIINAHNNRGNIIIPAFAIERTQEIIFTLAKLFKEKQIPPIPVYIDSPLAISATEIFQKNSGCFDEETKQILLSGHSPLDFPSLHYTKTADDSKMLNQQAAGSIIISASGMCTAGRIKHHLKYNLFKPESSVVFVGFQAEGTLGRRLIDGAKQVKLYGEDVAVRAKIYTLGGFSAHADMGGLMEWIGHIRNKNLKVFVVHGEPESSLHLADRIRSEFGYTVSVPEWGEIADLATFRSEIADYGRVDSYTSTDREIEALNESLQLLMKKYNDAKKQKKRINMKTLENDINDVREMISMINDDL
jgi:metallo-beta-lactamase family protein